MAAVGLFWIEPHDWPRYLVCTALLTVLWPFCLRLGEGTDIHLPISWTSCAAAYVLGPAVLPVYWCASLLGFVLVVALDRAGLVPAVGLAADSIRRYRGQPFELDSVVDGELRHTVLLLENGVRAAIAAALPAVPAVGLVLVGEAAVALLDGLLPIPGRMAPRKVRERLANAIGADMEIAAQLLRGTMTCFLVVAWRHGALPGFVAASLATILFHALLKRLADTLLESEAHRARLARMHDELERGERLALIGRTASTVFHQLGRQHGTIGMYAHLLARGPDGADPAAWARSAESHGARIAATLGEANRVIDELLRFAQDRSLNLYPHPVDAVVAECVDEVRGRAERAGVQLAVVPGPAIEAVLDKHKVKQALGNLLDNAIEASPPGARVEVRTRRENGHVHVAVRDHGGGIPPEVRERLGTPFCTTKPDGIGLGLALARELVEAHGGTLAFRDATPGAELELALPLSPAPSAAR